VGSWELLRIAGDMLVEVVPSLGKERRTNWAQLVDDPTIRTLTHKGHCSSNNTARDLVNHDVGSARIGHGSIHLRSEAHSSQPAPRP
jgi:hypothetical protein